MTRHERLALKIPTLLVAVVFLSHTSIALAQQCELHEVAKLTASDATASDLFGNSVSVSGDTAVVGAVLDDSAYVYRLIASTWVEEAKLTASDAAFEFGRSVSVSGNVAIVGAYAGPPAYVYRFNGSSWVEEQKLTASDAVGNDHFGWSVSVSGNIAIVGAPFDDCAAGIDCGSAYVYRFNGSTWVQQATLTASDAAASDLFGWFVSVSGDTAIVGAPAINVSRGSAYVYHYSGSTWVQQARLTASDAAVGDAFGLCVSVSGDAILVGAPYEQCATGSDCGSAYVYRLIGSTWVQEQKLIASDVASGEYFGYSVSISGDTAIVAATFADWVGCANCGSAYIYGFNGNTWVEEAKLTASDATTGDEFGGSVSVSGNLVILGADQDDCAAGANCGSAYVLALEGLPLPVDCNGNGIADECEADCNTNQVPDDCDIADGTSTDCNANAIPDECESQADCNNNGTQDICDVAGGTSLDCNDDEIPDECQLVDNDCNGNLIPDDCESTVDCNGNGLPDFCDLFTGTSADCNANSVPDECDIADGTSTDANGNGIPDECDTNLPPFIIEQPVDQFACEGETVIFDVRVGGMPPFTYQWRKDGFDLPGETGDSLTLASVSPADDGDYDVVVTNTLGSVTSDAATLSVVEFTEVELSPDPSGISKNRYLSFIPPATPCTTAIRVKMIDLQNPNPPNLPQYPPPNFSAYESATCSAAGEMNGCARWVGKPGTFLEDQNWGPAGGTYRAARLQCVPYYYDWSDEGLIHVTGAEIVPSSTYTVEMVQAACMGIEDTCTTISVPLTITTARSGDVEAPFQGPSPAPLTQPNALDIVQVVYKLSAVSGAPIKAIAQLQPNLVELNTDINALDIVAVVNAVKQFAYAFSGPCQCPSVVPCGVTTCTSPTICVSTYGAGSMCVKTCTGGANAGDPCINNSHCPGGGTCGNGLCRDRCGRCTP